MLYIITVTLMHKKYNLISGGRKIICRVQYLADAQRTAMRHEPHKNNLDKGPSYKQ